MAGEGALVAAIAGAQRGLNLCQSLLRAQLGQRVNVMILEKALTLELAHFENSDFYDKLTRARREASSRPLSLVTRTFGLAQNAISLLSFGSPAAALLAVGRRAADPRWLARVPGRSQILRRQIPSVPVALARDTHAAVSGNRAWARGPRQGSEVVWPGTVVPRPLPERFSNKLYQEDRNLTIRRDTWGFFLGLIATVTLYGAYAWIALSAITPRITLGQMTMYLMLFRQGQSAVLGNPLRGWRHVRRQFVSVDAVRLSGNAGERRARA